MKKGLTILLLVAGIILVVLGVLFLGKSSQARTEFNQKTSGKTLVSAVIKAIDNENNITIQITDVSHADNGFYIGVLVDDSSKYSVDDKVKVWYDGYYAYFIDIGANVTMFLAAGTISIIVGIILLLLFAVFIGINLIKKKDNFNKI